MLLDLPLARSASNPNDRPALVRNRTNRGGITRIAHGFPRRLSDRSVPFVRWKFRTVSIPMMVDNRTSSPRNREMPNAVSPTAMSLDQRSIPGFAMCSIYHFEAGGAFCSKYESDFCKRSLLVSQPLSIFV